MIYQKVNNLVFHRVSINLINNVSLPFHNHHFHSLIIKALSTGFKGRLADDMLQVLHVDLESLEKLLLILGFLTYR